jgi:hypothetical protein
MKFTRTLTASERRTIRQGALVILIFLALFGGFKACKFFAGLRTHYLAMVVEARQLRLDAASDSDEAMVVKKMMTDFHLDPGTLSTNSAVAEANAAIQKAARIGGIQIEAIHESPGGNSSKELATIEIEGSGQSTAVVTLIRQLPLLGSPLVIRSLQLTANSMPPGQVKLKVTVVVLNFDEWKRGGAPNA